MPNTLDSDGLTIKTLTEVNADLVTALKAIYGSDINVSSNSPDGQMINIFGQASIDILELLSDVYNSMSVDGAYGTVLDQRVALNGLTRRAGTYTITNVSITSDRALSLIGLDDVAVDPTLTPFTVSDDTGNQFYLVTGYDFATSGTQSLAFRAVDVGAVETTLNTITNQITTVLGITAVNNPTTYTSLGINEETDVELKIRHAKSLLLGSTGCADSIVAGLLALSTVTDAYVVENNTNGTVDSVPAHSVWCIAVGGTDEEVGTAIYNKLSAGCGMYGSESYVVTRPSGGSFTAKFDRGVAEDLYIQFSLLAKAPGVTFDTTLIKSQLASALSFKLNQPASINDVVVAMLTIEPNAIVTSAGVGDDGMSYGDIIQPTSEKYYFTVDAGNISIV